ncbi:uncharacterized protein MELLADRAFT_65176 [Melampsora larici-populina 98AG31]|uniref:RGS domain-containing protein n=1 Tax=Melampsora larici-populina (strain 98AG31 / pathotype 3-4-7) TaxID=747676 RepID=F4RU95_MELLP|nr:uncharacterized protein MELLADRAFT_65176 [Melampsora larici-populina 98AG31]EGG03897.1 hypothetical protein MELLADRAFT_65176 [Melampsora larici-populina 98AG31]
MSAGSYNAHFESKCESTTKPQTKFFNLWRLKPHFDDLERNTKSINGNSSSFRKVRSLISTPMNQIQLKDILKGEHLPPLTLKEFEDYLIHVEKSPENLWLQDYTRYYRQWEKSLAQHSSEKASRSKEISQDTPCYKNSSRSPRFDHQPFSPINFEISNQHTNISLHTPLPQDLLISKSIAVQTFFNSNSILELNLSYEVKRKILLDILVTSDPSIFRHVREETFLMLEESMRRWLIRTEGNADDSRIAFAICLGLTGITLSILIVSLILINPSQRYLRLLITPLFWLSLSTLVSGLYRTCPIIYLFGSYRQIHSWELLKGVPDPNEVNFITLKNTSIFFKFGSPTRSDHSEETDLTHPRLSPVLISYGNLSANHPNQLDPLNFFQESNKLTSHHQTWFKLRPELPKTSVFSPLTKIISPIVKDALKLNIIKSLVWASLLTLFWCFGLVFEAKLQLTNRSD